MTKRNVEIITDLDKAIEVLRDASRFMSDTGKSVSKWWSLENLNKEFLLQHTKPDEWFVALIDGKPASCVVLQQNDINKEDWSHVAEGKHEDSLYVHWLATHRDFAGQNASKILMDYAEELARKKGLSLVRLDVDSSNDKLREIYDKLDYKHILDKDEGYRTTSFYQKEVN